MIFFSLSATSLPHPRRFTFGVGMSPIMRITLSLTGVVFSVWRAGLFRQAERCLRHLWGHTHCHKANPILPCQRLQPVILEQITVLLIVFQTCSFEPELSFSRRFPSQSWKLTLVWPPVHCKLLFRCCLCGLHGLQLQDAGAILLAAESGPPITTKGNGFHQGPPWPWGSCVVRLLITASDICHKCLGMKTPWSQIPPLPLRWIWRHSSWSQRGQAGPLILASPQFLSQSLLPHLMSMSEVTEMSQYLKFNHRFFFVPTSCLNSIPSTRSLGSDRLPCLYQN